ncbi:MAG TPA: hypothetical protein VJ044_10465 [Candidatus Hodarchaeales archaeon]|nr:hypothetical protein [Candidatus Hodarchaeales archaeon]
MSNLEKKSDIPEKLIVRHYGKVVYFWPVLLIGIVIFLIDYFSRSAVVDLFFKNEVNPTTSYESYIAAIWIVVFAFNVIVATFDFTLGKVFMVVVVLFLLILVYTIALPQGLAGISLASIVSSTQMGASATFYLALSLLFLVLLLIDWFRARYEFWSFEGNRIVHHRGILEREMSFSAQNSRVTTSTEDIFERILFRAGTIYIQDPDKHIYVLDNVFGAVSKDKMIQKILSSSLVRVRSE